MEVSKFFAVASALSGARNAAWGAALAHGLLGLDGGEGEVVDFQLVEGAAERGAGAVHVAEADLGGRGAGGRHRVVLEIAAGGSR